MSVNPEDTQVANPFGPTQLVAVPQNVSAQALEGREVAEVQAAYVIAHKFPRDQRAAMDRVLTACTRLSLAEVAVYQYARGGTSITGPSIRMAEELARCWGNLACGVVELSRHGGQSECLAYCVDLETNVRDEKRFTVRHWRDTKSGGYAAKDERDIYEIVANQGARRKRACILALIPGDVVESALEQCEVTLKSRVDLTPEKVKSMLEKFSEVGVSRPMIEKRIQRSVDSISPALMVNLGRIYTSIRDGVAKPTDFFEHDDGTVGEAPAVATGIAGAKERLKKAKPIADADATPPDNLL